MKRAGFLLFLGAAITANLVTACSSSSGGGTTTTTTTHTGGNTTTTSSTTSSSSTTTTSAALDCASYCSSIMTNCTGTNAQFSGMDTCMGFCAAYPAGTAADTSGDTLGCRTYHAGAAAGSAANATTHCPHAGPTGGDKDPKGTAGICGEPCTAFCEAAAKICPTTFADMTVCKTACDGFKADTAAYSISDTMTNDMGCRFYHLSAASASTAAATTHCPHIATVSTQCTM